MPDASTPAAASAVVPRPLDGASQRWVEGLRPASPRHREALEELHALLLRVAGHELRRRRHLLGSITGPELDDLGQQAADDALLSILDRVAAFRGESRFTTWAYKFAVFEVSSKVARHVWRHRPPDAEPLWDRIPDAFTPHPDQSAERREQLVLLARAVDSELTERQRAVFVAVALNEVPIDVVALELGSNRNALYKNLFDARRKLRAHLAAAGHPVGTGEGEA